VLIKTLIGSSLPKKCGRNPSGSDSIYDIVSVACKQDVSSDRYPKSVAADEGDLNKYPYNREHRENQGD
jgi:hypothetical protein